MNEESTIRTHWKSPATGFPLCWGTAYHSFNILQLSHDMDESNCPECTDLIRTAKESENG